ncbi:MAG: transcriptional repressor LexA [Bacillota bacterium]|nr:transcriptional repressor LexA [Bacillota bacterium]
MTKGMLKENEIFEFIKKKIEDDGLPPSIREICKAVSLSSPSSVFSYLKSLEKKGLIIIQKGKKRAIMLPDMNKSSMSYIPVLGRVTAGLPILAIEEVIDKIPIDRTFVRGRDLFALTVKGDSMKNAAILDGDYVVVEKTPVCNNHDIVVALIGDEATVKRFYKENGHFRLQPENEEYKPIICDDVSILGRVVMVIRQINY